jgi:hypothetical protein
MLTITQGKGFRLKFENGLTISVQFGKESYCSQKGQPQQSLQESEDAEIAIWDMSEKWFSFGHDNVEGYVSADEVANWITATKQAKDIFSIITPTKI